MTRDDAKKVLKENFPRNPMEIEEYLSWAPWERFGVVSLLEDFAIWLSK